MIRWILSEDNGTWSVERNPGHTVYDGTLEECEDYVRSRRDRRDTVTRIEADGYHWDLTTHLR